MQKGHGGNIFELARKLGCEPSQIIDMSSNVNPLGPLPGLVDFLKEGLNTITALPEVDAYRTAQLFAFQYNLDSDQVIVGNGTTQFIFTIPQVLKSRRALILGPTYSDYAKACKMFNVPHDYLMVEESRAFQPDIVQLIQQVEGYDTVFVCNPNNPTGALLPRRDLEEVCRSYPNTYFIIDESYLPFVIGADLNTMMYSSLQNVLILNSMSKIYGIPGLRLGFLISSQQIIEKFRPFLLPWSVNSLAQSAVEYLIKHSTLVDKFIDKTTEFIEAEKTVLTEIFENVTAIKLFPSTTCFMLARLQGKNTADMICDHLAADGVLIRNCSNFAGLSEHFIRVSLKTSEINRMVADKISKFLHNA